MATAYDHDDIRQESFLIRLESTTTISRKIATNRARRKLKRDDRLQRGLPPYAELDRVSINEPEIINATIDPDRSSTTIVDDQSVYLALTDELKSILRQVEGQNIESIRELARAVGVPKNRVYQAAKLSRQRYEDEKNRDREAPNCV